MAPVATPAHGLQIPGTRIRVPWEAVGAVAALAGVVLVLRARSSGSNVAQVGPTTSNAVTPYAGYVDTTAADYSAQLDNLQQQLGDLASLLAQQDQSTQPTGGAQPPTSPAPPPTPPPPAPPPAAPAPPPAPAPPKTFTVGHWPDWSGSLWGIAQHFTGSGTNWPQLYALNRGVIGPNPNLIHPGQVLQLPAGWGG